MSLFLRSLAFSSSISAQDLAVEVSSELVNLLDRCEEDPMRILKFMLSSLDAVVCNSDIVESDDSASQDQG